MNEIAKYKASLTVETALTLPLFLFFIVCLLTPVKLMNEQRQIQAVLESVCEKTSQYTYIKDSIEHGDQKLQNETWLSQYGQYLGDAVGAYAAAQVLSQVNRDVVTGISFGRSSIMEDGETIDLILDYRLKLPFSVFHLDSIPATGRCIRRAWIGKSGISQNMNEKDNTAEIVYIGKYSTRYHKSRECHYLFNQFQTVALKNIEEYRNMDGSRYKPCSYCGDEAGEMVYILPGGERYHSSKNCAAIAAYVQAVPISQVEYLGPCSYCSGG